MRSLTPMARKTFVRWALTVFSLMPSRSAITLLGIPLPTSARTARSRSVSPVSGRSDARAVSSSRAARELLTARASDRPDTGLTERERAVLALVGSGMPNKVIALRLGISEKTVKAHLTNVFRAIGVTDRTQAALWAQRNGLVQADGSPS